LGMASVTSQMKKSWIGWRSGRRGERSVGSVTGGSCDYTDGRSIVLSHSNVKHRVFTQNQGVSCFHPGRPAIVLLHRLRRVSTQRRFVYLHRAAGKNGRPDSCLGGEIDPLTHSINSDITQEAGTCG